MKEPIYNLLVELDFTNKTKEEKNSIMKKISDSINAICEKNNIEPCSDLYGLERTDAYDTYE